MVTSTPICTEPQTTTKPAGKTVPAYTRAERLLKDARAKRGAREAWVHLQKATIHLHLEDVAEIDTPASRLDHPRRQEIFGGIRSEVRRRKGQIPYVLGLSLLHEGADHDLVRLLVRIEEGFFPGVDERWTDAFLAAGVAAVRPCSAHPAAEEIVSASGDEAAVLPASTPEPVVAAQADGLILAIMGSRLAERVARVPSQGLEKSVRIVDVGSAGKGFHAVDAAVRGIRAGAYRIVLLSPSHMHQTSIRTLREAAGGAGIPFRLLPERMQTASFWQVCRDALRSPSAVT
jgi:hypothetical protein